METEILGLIGTDMIPMTPGHARIGLMYHLPVRRVSLSIRNVLNVTVKRDKTI
ncbi:MAG: hypothetical protein ABR911_04325 [Syntrophales bacterium]